MLPHIMTATTHHNQPSKSYVHDNHCHLRFWTTTCDQRKPSTALEVSTFAAPTPGDDGPLAPRPTTTHQHQAQVTLPPTAADGCQPSGTRAHTTTPRTTALPTVHQQPTTTRPRSPHTRCETHQRATSTQSPHRDCHQHRRARPAPPLVAPPRAGPVPRWAPYTQPGTGHPGTPSPGTGHPGTPTPPEALRPGDLPPALHREPGHLRRRDQHPRATDHRPHPARPHPPIHTRRRNPKPQRT